MSEKTAELIRDEFSLEDYVTQQRTFEHSLLNYAKMAKDEKLAKIVNVQIQVSNMLAMGLSTKYKELQASDAW